MPTAFTKVARDANFNMKGFHYAMQAQREQGKNVTLKQFLSDTWGQEYTPEQFYAELGIDPSQMTVEKMFNTSELTRYLFPEVFRDALLLGLSYTPIHPALITADEPLQSTGVTMPMQNALGADEVRLRDVKEGATITEGDTVAFSQKQVTIRKKGRGLKMTYESIMFTPINLATVFFQELGARLGSDLDVDAIDVLINGDQADGSQAAPVIGAATANALTFMDIVRAWVRFRRIGRQSTVMLMNEADAITVLSMDEFNNRPGGGGAGQFAGRNAPTLNIQNPLPTSQDLYVHDGIPAKKIIFVDTARAMVQLTAMPLLVETEKIVARQLTGEYVSIITGFANIFKDGRLILDYATDLTTNPGPSAVY